MQPIAWPGPGVRGLWWAPEGLKGGWGHGSRGFGGRLQCASQNGAHSQRAGISLNNISQVIGVDILDASWQVLQEQASSALPEACISNERSLMGVRPQNELQSNHPHIIINSMAAGTLQPWRVHGQVESWELSWGLPVALLPN